SIGIIAAVSVIAAAALASTGFAPLALALFIIALVSPMQSRLQARMPNLAALAITLLMPITVALAFASLAVSGFGRGGPSLVTNATRYQALFDSAVTWLDGHGVSVAGLWAEQFNVGWLVRAMRLLTGRVNTTLSFWIIALVYITLGLPEMNEMQQRVERLQN